MENTKTKRLSTKSMVLCAMFTALVAVGAFIQIPVPYMDYFTLQFFFVLLAGLILGGNKGESSGWTLWIWSWDRRKDVAGQKYIQKWILRQIA